MLRWVPWNGYLQRHLDRSFAETGSTPSPCRPVTPSQSAHSPHIRLSSTRVSPISKTTKRIAIAVSLSTCYRGTGAPAGVSADREENGAEVISDLPRAFPRSIGRRKDSNDES